MDQIKNKNYKMFVAYSLIVIVLFLVCSTSYIPKKLINSIEIKFKPIATSTLHSSRLYYVYVLGAGASADSRLPPIMNLSSTTLTRLVEGIRIYNRLPHVILVTSAAMKGRRISQAELSKEAAVSLGVKKQNILMLETPTSTLEEAMAFKHRFGTKKNIILVTSALHMPRAVEIFSDQGIKVIPAPTDYLYKEFGSIQSGITFPSFNSINLLTIYQTTVLKHLYYKWIKKPKDTIS
ncbi:YdcF family protein [Flavobacterium sp. 7A]|uniref:YdcF family protein n=1 Tax=Flavobacterium sp. 7A TaxID=2940571 RepID=UPI00222809D7|nr:ElyC/SanA/YdcF family protein [Flavobacterium sp. 7A]MCW2120292.1 uncharacterized SAM-binding protein YcdF (DUF218 family) [Flavobacterium sp. 7A]